MTQLLEARRPFRARTVPKAIVELSERVHDALYWQEDEAVRRMVARYDEFYDALEKDLQQLHAQAFGDEAPTFTQWQKVQGDRRAAAILAKHLQGLDVTLNQDSEDLFYAFWKDSYNRYAWMLDQATPPQLDITYRMPPDPFIRAFAATPWQGAMFSQRIGAINDEMARNIQSQVTASMIGGEGAYTLGRRIRGLVGIGEEETLVTRPRAGRAKWRSDMIARTELNRLSRQAQRFFFEQNRDIIADEVWLAFEGDARTCEDCERLDGKTRKQVEKMGFDFDEPAHPNCRCTRVPVPKPLSQLLGPQFEGIPSDIAGTLAYEDPKGRKTVQDIQDFDAWVDEYLTPYEKAAE